jgi:hypothetical protein
MKIYVVTKNADFTEGRGPMLYHSTYRSLEGARNYVKDHAGIYGSPQYEEPSKMFGAIGERRVTRPFNAKEEWVAPINTREYWNGYEIHESVLGD